MRDRSDGFQPLRRRRPRHAWVVACFGVCLGAAVQAFAASTIVSSEAALAAALAAASPGDEIVLRDGAYRGKFELGASGSAERPIVVRAEHPLRAIFEESHFELKGRHGVLRDFVFEGSGVAISGSFNDVSHSLFRSSGGPAKALKAAVWTSGGASYNRIHHNELTRWSTFGFRIWQPDAATRGNRIDHNYIHDYSNRESSNEPEVFQIGSSQTTSNVDLASVIEYNLVERVRITGELLSLKSSGNLVRGNTFVDITGAVQGRHGSNNTFLNNSLIGGKTVLPPTAMGTG
jgi:poly(beta-D-mannuronate) lyase